MFHAICVQKNEKKEKRKKEEFVGVSSNFFYHNLQKLVIILAWDDIVEGVL